MRKLWPSCLTLALAAGFSLWAYPRLPGQVVTHWGFDGEPNGWSSPIVAALVLPVIAAVLLLVFLVIPRIDPRRESWEMHGATYWLMTNLVLCFVLCMHIVVLGSGLGWKVSMSRMVPIAVGALFVVLGNFMPRMRPNWFMGIRTPWTLSSDEVWRRTHRIGGVCFMLAGVLIAVIGFARGTMAPIIIIAGAGVSVLMPIVYSWVLWRRSLPPTPGAER